MKRSKDSIKELFVEEPEQPVVELEVQKYIKPKIEQDKTPVDQPATSAASKKPKSKVGRPSTASRSSRKSKISNSRPRTTKKIVETDDEDDHLVSDVKGAQQSLVYVHHVNANKKNEPYAAQGSLSSSLPKDVKQSLEVSMDDKRNINGDYEPLEMNASSRKSVGKAKVSNRRGQKAKDQIPKSQDLINLAHAGKVILPRKIGSKPGRKAGPGSA